MKAKIKEIYSVELTCSLEEYWPNDMHNFGFTLRLIVGADGVDGGESFDLLVCTPDWIKHQYASEGCVFGRHMLIVFEYELSIILKKIESYIANCVGHDWSEIARKISEVAAWEFDDYQGLYGRTAG